MLVLRNQTVQRAKQHPALASGIWVLGQKSQLPLWFWCSGAQELDPGPTQHLTALNSVLQGAW